MLWQQWHPVTVKLSDAQLPWTLLILRLITPVLVGTLLGGLWVLGGWLVLKTRK